MKVLVFGGTTEGRLLARELSALGAQVTVSVATALGAEELRGVPPLTVCVGRKDTRQMREMLPGFAVCVDATHPYAAEASGNIRAACLAAGVPYRRLLRGASALPPDSVVVPDAPAAARWLAGTQGNILLATGAKELAAFAGLDAERPAGAAHARGACGLRGGGRAPRQYHCAAGAFYAGAQRGADAPF